MITGLVLSAGLALAPPQTPPQKLRLAPCSPEPALQCLHVATTLPSHVTAGTDLNDRDGWTVGFQGLELPVATVEPNAEEEAEFHLLVLVDLSGSMRGQGIQIVRSALRSFFSDLPSHVRVAVAPFSSRRVAPVIEGATFRSGAEAALALERLPAPAGNTGLYSAIAAGIERVETELRAVGSMSGGVLVFTDGRNDVDNRGDDPELLSGDAGRSHVAARVRDADIPTWVLGVGTGVDATELAAIVADPALVSLVPSLDPVAVSVPLARVRSSFFRSWLIESLAPRWAQLRLRRGPLEIDVSAWLGSGETAERWSLAWTPPLFLGTNPARAARADVRPVDLAASAWVVAGFLALLSYALGHLVYAVAASGHQPKLRASGTRRRSKGEGLSDPEVTLRSAVETAPRTANQPTASRAVRQ